MRQRKGLASALHKQRRHDGHGERNAQPDLGALLRGADVHRTTNFLHIGAHHVQANTPARHGGDLVLGGKPRRTDQVDDLAVGDFLHPLFGDQAFFNRFSHHQRQVDAAAIVSHINDDHAAFVAGAQRDGTGFFFAFAQAHVG